MKKLFTLLLILLIFSSCSKDEIIPDAKQNSISEMEISKKEENPIVQFKDTEDFLKEYSKLSNYGSQEDFNDWIKQKGHTALLTKSDSIFKISDSIGVLYSDALMAILNKNAEFIIGEETIWLNNDKFYVVSKNENSYENKISNKKSLKLYGSLFNLGKFKEYNLEELNSNKYEHANKWKTYVQNVGSRRLITELYNETIYFSNGTISSSKMFLRYRIDYESCSFWRCTWKSDTSGIRNIFLDLTKGGKHWNGSGSNAENIFSGFQVAGSYSTLLGNYQYAGPEGDNFYVTGTVTTSYNGYTWSLPITWY